MKQIVILILAVWICATPHAQYAPRSTAGSSGVWTFGTTAPSGGKDGDRYWRTDTRQIYKRESGSWSVVITLPAAQTQADWNETDNSAIGFVKNKPAAAFTNNPTHSIITTAAAANGFLLSSTRNAQVAYSVSITTTSTIGSAGAGYVVLEICATNSATAGDWVEIGRATNSQTITLAAVLQSVQVASQSISGVVPAGYYVRLRSVASSGSPVFAFVSGQEILQ